MNGITLTLTLPLPLFFSPTLQLTDDMMALKQHEQSLRVLIQPVEDRDRASAAPHAADAFPEHVKLRRVHIEDDGVAVWLISIYVYI